MTSKAIEKQGLQIKKTPKPKPSSSGTQSSAGRLQHQRNWSALSLSTIEKGGGGQLHTNDNAIVGKHELHQTCPYETLTQAHAGRLQFSYNCWIGITNNY